MALDTGLVPGYRCGCLAVDQCVHFSKTNNNKIAVTNGALHFRCWTPNNNSNINDKDLFYLSITFLNPNVLNNNGKGSRCKINKKSKN